MNQPKPRPIYPATREVIQSYKILADFLIAHDETERAERLLTDIQIGYHRDNPVPEIQDLLRKLHGYLMTLDDYAKNVKDHEIATPKRSLEMLGTQRGILIGDQVKKMNTEGKIPHLYEMGPGDYWLPISLREVGMKFTYDCTHVSDQAYQNFKEIMKHDVTSRIPGEPVLFVACELVEHLRDPRDILVCMNRIGVIPDQIHLSTPMYLFGKPHKTWDEDSSLGTGQHLRTYTPDEFMGIASQLFPAYNFNIIRSEVMSLVGFKK